MGEGGVSASHPQGLGRQAHVDMAVSPPPPASAPAAPRTVVTVSPRRSRSSHPDLRPR